MCRNNLSISILNTETTIWTAKVPQNLLHKNIPGHQVWKRRFSSKRLFLYSWFAVVWDFSPPRDSARYVAGSVFSTRQTLPYPFPEIYGSSGCYQRTITTRAQIKALSAEILLGTALGMQDKARRGLGLLQQEDRRWGLQFSLFSFSCWTLLREGLCWSTRNRL